jgi:hypothetical protein
MAEAAAAEPILKEANASRLAAVLAVNVAAYYLSQKSGDLAAGEWAKLATGWISALPAGAAVALTGILNAQITSTAKARLVFWRWHNPLPGSEAFTQHGPNDPRVNMAALEAKHGPMPTDPKAQNILWYAMYRSVAGSAPVAQAHRQFLFARDYAFMALVMLLTLGVAAAIFIRPSLTAGIYILILIIQWGAATNAANINGHRLVTSVLAIKATT